MTKEQCKKQRLLAQQDNKPDTSRAAFIRERQKIATIVFGDSHDVADDGAAAVALANTHVVSMSAVSSGITDI